MKPYYYVYRVSSGRGPVVKHTTVEEAVAESQRLSAQHPGDTFEILKCLAITRTTEPATFWNDEEFPSPQYRYFTDGDGSSVWRVDGVTGEVLIAHPEDPIWDRSHCTLDDLLTTPEITADQLPDPIKP